MFIDAEVTRLHTNYALPPDVNVARLVHTEQQRLLLERAGSPVPPRRGTDRVRAAARLPRVPGEHQGARL